MFLKGKELWGHIDETSKAPEDAKDLSAWKMGVLEAYLLPRE